MPINYILYTLGIANAIFKCEITAFNENITSYHWELFIDIKDTTYIRGNTNGKVIQKKRRL